MQHETPSFLHLSYPQRNQYAADSFILRLRDTTEVVYRRRSKGRQNANNPFRYPNGKPMVSSIKTTGFRMRNLMIMLMIMLMLMLMGMGMLMVMVMGNVNGE